MRSVFDILLFSYTIHNCYGVFNPKSKFLAEEVTSENFRVLVRPKESKLSSKYSVSMGSCSVEKPFVFHISAGNVEGALGYTSSTNVFSLYSNDVSNDKMEFVGEPQQFFPFDSNTDTNYQAKRIIFSDVPPDGAMVQVSCSQVEQQVLMITRDDSNVALEAAESVEKSNENDYRVVLMNGAKSETKLRGEARGRLREKVRFADASNTKIVIRRGRETPKDVLVLIHAKIRDKNGRTLQRTLVTATHEKPKPVFHMDIKASEIDHLGDIKITFRVLGGKTGRKGKTIDMLKLDARVALQVKDGEKNKLLSVADISAILPRENIAYVLHSGWIRRKLAEHRLAGKEEGLDVVVTDAYLTDPDNGYELVGKLENSVVLNNIFHGNSIKNKARRKYLTALPTPQENGISEEMLKGRKPVESYSGRLRRRRLHGNSYKILLHGYCDRGRSDAGPFPLGEFGHAIVFQHPDTPAAWSHHTFSIRFQDFAKSKGIKSCGCIAHSQGGAACLHTYNFFWSCLDYSIGGSRMIQSVGTPYLGTPLAMELAVIGRVFGVGCGAVRDLDHRLGALIWLSGTSSWARREVHYYTTSFKDKWWRYDYCHIAADLLLSDPDDGVVERARGQLADAYNMGHKTGWCHASGMRDTPQYKDSSRNSEMNTYAQY